MEQVTIIGLDLAKRVFQVHGATAHGRVAFRKKLSRGQVLAFFAGLLKPTAGFLVIVVPFWILATSVVPGALIPDPGITLVTVWFIAVYLTIMALSPLTLEIHERCRSLAAAG